jgi:hypothetical protein
MTQEQKELLIKDLCAEDLLNMYGVQGWKLVGYSSDAVLVMGVTRTYQFILMREDK